MIILNEMENHLELICSKELDRILGAGRRKRRQSADYSRSKDWKYFDKVAVVLQREL